MAVLRQVDLKKRSQQEADRVDVFWDGVIQHGIVAMGAPICEEVFSGTGRKPADNEAEI